MRNVFDQYQQPENRLSHALAVCLDEDRKLLHGFLLWIGVSAPCGTENLSVVEQSLPGDPPELEDEVERRGLPDIVIHDGKTWCVLIESKIQAALTSDQLGRHTRTLQRRGFDRVWCVALTKVGVVPPPDVIGRAWCGLYEWLGKAGAGREWADRLRAYLRIAELRLAREEYLTEGTLTMFDGFPFSPENPYTYGEAKRLLKLAMSEIRKDGSLLSLGMAPTNVGRGAIRGEVASHVWDCILLKEHPAGKPHSVFPHLTLAVHVDHLEVAVSIPDGVSGTVLRRLVDLGSEGKRSFNATILKQAAPLIKQGARVQAFALQRHYPSRSSQPTLDAEVKFKLETSQNAGAGRVKGQPEWMDLYFSLMERKAGNIHFAYAVSWPWGTPGLDTRQSLAMMIQGWKAMGPLLEILRGNTADRKTSA